MLNWIFLLATFYAHHVSCSGIRPYTIQPIRHRFIFSADLQSRIFSDRAAFNFESDDVRKKVYENQRVQTLSLSGISVIEIEFGTESYEQAQQDEATIEAAKTPFSIYKTGNVHQYTSSYPSYTCFNVQQGLETVKLSFINVISNNYIPQSTVASFRMQTIVGFLKPYQRADILAPCPESARRLTKFPKARNYHPRKLDKIPFWCIRLMVQRLFNVSQPQRTNELMEDLFPLHTLYILDLRAFDTIKSTKNQFNWYLAGEPLFIAYTKSDLLAPFVFSLKNDSMIFVGSDKIVMVIEFHPSQPDAKSVPRESLRLSLGELIQIVCPDKNE